MVFNDMHLGVTPHIMSHVTPHIMSHVTPFHHCHPYVSGGSLLCYTTIHTYVCTYVRLSSGHMQGLHAACMPGAQLSAGSACGPVARGSQEDLLLPQPQPHSGGHMYIQVCAQHRAKCRSFPVPSGVGSEVVEKRGP